MRTVLDSSVLLPIQRRQPGWEAWRDAITRAATEGSLLICPVDFAECSLGYPSAQIALRRMESIQVHYDDIAPETAYLAGQTFLRYRTATASHPRLPDCRPRPPSSRPSRRHRPGLSETLFFRPDFACCRHLNFCFSHDRSVDRPSRRAVPSRPLPPIHLPQCAAYEMFQRIGHRHYLFLTLLEQQAECPDS